jgi:hypothetical protein
MIKLKDPVGIKLERTTRTKLKLLGTKDDTYEDIICNLMDIERINRDGPNPLLLNAKTARKLKEVSEDGGD